VRDHTAAASSLRRVCVRCSAAALRVARLPPSPQHGERAAASLPQHGERGADGQLHAARV